MTVQRKEFLRTQKAKVRSEYERLTEIYDTIEAYEQTVTDLGVLTSNKHSIATGTIKIKCAILYKDRLPREVIKEIADVITNYYQKQVEELESQLTVKENL